MLDAGVAPDAVAGHSIGEWSASVLAGVLSATDAMELVRARGDAMALACEEEPTGLAAVLGSDRRTVIDAASKFGLVVANDNGPGQLVVGGTLQQLQDFAANAPSGSRARILDVAGAFHTEAMHSAVAVVTRLATTLEPSDAHTPMISNRDGATITNGQQILDQMVDQIAMPVRWDLVMDRAESIGVTSTVEMCPAGTLSGIVRRRLPNVTTCQVNSPADTADVTSPDLRSNELMEAHQ